jgi:hypothetical protein
MTLNLTVYPLGRGLYEARLGSTVLCRSKTPFLSAARALLEANHAPETQLTMAHEGSDVVAMRATLGTAARLTVEETHRSGPNFRPYRPHPRPSMAPAATEGDTVDARWQGLR